MEAMLKIIHLLWVSLHTCFSNTCRVFLYYYYWTGNINFFCNVVLHGIFLNWEPELCHNLQNLLNLQKFPCYTVCAISYFNALTPKILIEILLIVCHTILLILVWRIWYWIKLLSPNWYFSLFLSLVWLILYQYCKEKFCLGHSWELLGYSLTCKSRAKCGQNNGNQTQQWALRFFQLLCRLHRLVIFITWRSSTCWLQLHNWDSNKEHD